MTYLLIALIVLSVAFGAPALIDPARRAAVRRADVRTRREATENALRQLYGRYWAEVSALAQRRMLDAPSDEEWLTEIRARASAPTRPALHRICVAEALQRFRIVAEATLAACKHQRLSRRRYLLSALGGQETAAVKAALARLWTQFPETAGVGETLTYKARVQVGLLQEAQERNLGLEQREQQVQHRRQHIRDGKPVTAGYRLRALAGLVLFLAVLVLGIVLDYLIFRGLHPTGTRLLPIALACLAVIGITTGSVLFLDANRHHLVPASATPYHRRVLALGGAMLAAGIVVYMVVIAPYRSYQAGEARITQAQQQLASDQSEVLAGAGGSNAELIAADTQAVARARADLAQAQRVDRWSAAALGVLEIPLAEAGFLGAELLLLDFAVARREIARRRNQRANNAVQQADNTFIDALHQTLVRHGHTNADDLIPRIIARGDWCLQAMRDLEVLVEDPVVRRRLKRNAERTLHEIEDRGAGENSHRDLAADAGRVGPIMWHRGSTRAQSGADWESGEAEDGPWNYIIFYRRAAGPAEFEVLAVRGQGQIANCWERMNSELEPDAAALAPTDRRPSRPGATPLSGIMTPYLR